MRILCVGANHRTAGVELREKLAFDAARTVRGLHQLVSRWPDAQFAILSTCNRSEVYTARAVHGHPRAEELSSWLAEFHGLPIEACRDALYTLPDAQAAEHLFAVAAGLDSLVLGEDQIVRQVREAYQAASQVGACRGILGELFQAALRVAKQVRSETDINVGKVSVASVAIDAAVRALGSLDGKCVLNVGAGKMNELMLRHLVELGCGQIVVVNRSTQRARELADRCGGEAAPFAELAERLADADVVLTSTGAELPILTAEMIATAQQRRGNRLLLVIGLAVPRDVEQAARNVPNVLLYNIDDLEKVVAETLHVRKAQLEAARRILDGHVARLMQELNIRGVAPTLDALYQRMQGIADEELAQAVRKLSTHDDADSDTEILQRTLHRTIRRILHSAATNLRQEAGSDAARAYVSALRKLFDLDK